MKILVAGDSQIVLTYSTWIADAVQTETGICTDISECLHLLSKARWDVLVLAHPEDPEGLLDLTVQFKTMQPHLKVIIICEDEPGLAVRSLKMGADDYIVSPAQRERLVGSVQKLLADNDPPHPGRDREGNGAEEAWNREFLPGEMLFGGSTKMEAIGAVVRKVVDADLPILITGESGTGKEMVARYIWQNSRRDGPFVRVNCAAIPSDLLESELFGYEKGAFTGAYKRREGKFEAANGGYLFLDEIGDLPYPAQSKLLHVLQDGSFSSLGSTRDIHFDVGIIASTNQNLEDLVKRGSFREDLFFRINVVHIKVPPLRERAEQLEILIDYFIDKYARKYETRPTHLSPENRSLLFSYAWPGNVRELENVIRSATVLGTEKAMNRVSGLAQVKPVAERNPVHHHQAEEGGNVSGPPMGRTNDGAPNGALLLREGKSLKEISKMAALSAEREAIAKVLHQTRWNRKKTARILEVSYKTLLTKIKETGLDEN